MRRAGFVIFIASVVLSASPLAAQGLEGKIGRFYDDAGWTVYRLGLRRPLIGPLGTTLHGDYLERVGEGGFAGLGFDVTAFQGSPVGPPLQPQGSRAPQTSLQ